MEETQLRFWTIGMQVMIFFFGIGQEEGNLYRTLCIRWELRGSTTHQSGRVGTRVDNPGSGGLEPPKNLPLPCLCSSRAAIPSRASAPLARDWRNDYLNAVSRKGEVLRKDYTPLTIGTSWDPDLPQAPHTLRHHFLEELCNL